MKVSLIQMDSGSDKDPNFTKAKKLLDSAILEKPDVICLPECFLYSGEKEYEMAEIPNSEKISYFKDFARKNSVNLILGTIAIKHSLGKKVTNTCFVINRKGKIVLKYDKMFMYDVNRPDLVFRESDTVVPGKKLGLCKIDGVQVGIGVCVDLRYPEYFRALVAKGAKVIFLPSSFRKATGSIAWDVLTKARAIENQVYFCACNQTGGKENKERCGKTRVVSYTGEILSEIESGEWFTIADLDFTKQDEFRNKFPVLKQKKFEIKLKH